MTYQTPQPGPTPWQQEPGLLPFMPMLYVAWADGDLTKDEIASIRERMCADPELEQSEALKTWLDPTRPPTQDQLAKLLRDIRGATDKLADVDPRSLADLGLEIAKLNATPDNVPSSADRKALMELEAELGLVGHYAAYDIMPVRAKMPIPPMEEAAPSFDVAALTAMLDQPNAETRNQIRSIVQDSAFTRDFELNKEGQREQVLEWCRELARRGVGRLAYPGITTEAATDMGDFIAAFETLGFFDHSLVVKFGVQFGLFGGSIYFLGTAHHHAKYLEDASTMELPGCFAMTELGHGSNVRDLETIARYVPESDTFEVHSPTEAAGKMWIGNAAAHGRLATVFAQLEVDGEGHGVHAVLVPIRDAEGQLMPGVRVEDCGHKMGLNGVDNGMIWFDRVHVPRENLLDRFGQVNDDGQYHSPIASPSRRFFTMLGTLVAGRVSVASAGLSAQKVGLAIAVRYGARRRQFGPTNAPETPILNYRSHQRKLMPLLATTYACHFALRSVTQRYLNRTEADEREVEALAAAVKVFSTRHTTQTLQTCREACGGQGYLSDNLIASFKNDTDVFTTFEGDNTVLMQLVAKSLLTAWRQQFMESKVFGVLRHLAHRATTAIAERNPVVARRTDSEHLRDPAFHAHVMMARQDDLTASVAARLKRRIDDGIDPFDAFNDCQDHLISLAWSYADRVFTAAFAAAISDAEPTLAAALRPVYALFALATLEQDMAWFLENGYFEASKAKAIRTEVNALCAEVRQQAVPLVDAFGIPEACIDVPIN